MSYIEKVAKAVWRFWTLVPKHEKLNFRKFPAGIGGGGEFQCQSEGRLWSEEIKSLLPLNYFTILDQILL